MKTRQCLVKAYRVRVIVSLLGLGSCFSWLLVHDFMDGPKERKALLGAEIWGRQIILHAGRTLEGWGLSAARGLAPSVDFGLLFSFSWECVIVLGLDVHKEVRSKSSLRAKILLYINLNNHNSLRWLREWESSSLSLTYWWQFRHKNY